MKRENVDEAYAKLQEAVEMFNKAIADFQWQYNPESIGLDEWIEHNEDVMFDISTDIDSYFEDRA